MKPTLGMEVGKSSYPVTIEKTEDAPKTKSKLVRNAAIALISFVVVVAVVVVAVYFGIKATKDTYQEAWHIFRDQEGHYMEERVNKTKDTTEVDVPNSVQIIYDYKNGISVERYTDVRTKVRGPCYAKYLSQDKSAGDMQTTDGAGERNSTSKGKVEMTQHWKFTERKVPAYLTTSPRVQEMCKDTEIFWMEEVLESSIQKRVPFNCFLDRIVAAGYNCCYWYYLCYDSAWVYRYTYWELWCYY